MILLTVSVKFITKLFVSYMQMMLSCIRLLSWDLLMTIFCLRGCLDCTCQRSSTWQSKISSEKYCYAVGITQPSTVVDNHVCCLVSTLWVKKTRHQTLAHNFTKYRPIFRIFHWRTRSKFATKVCLNIHHALNLSLHCLVKYKCQKMASSWNMYCN